MAKKSKPNAASSGQTQNRVDLTELESVLKFMEKHGLEQLEYEREGVRIVLRKGGGPSGGAASRSSPASSPALDPSVRDHATASPSATSVPAHGEAPAEDLHVVKSPIVGTFYAAPSPDATPFVAVGGRVEAGQVLCIIEAMKLMNEIESDISGELVRIFPDNASPVEYGESLFGIRPDRKK